MGIGIADTYEFEGNDLITVQLRSLSKMTFNHNLQNQSLDDRSNGFFFTKKSSLAGCLSDVLHVLDPFRCKSDSLLIKQDDYTGVKHSNCENQFRMILGDGVLMMDMISNENGYFRRHFFFNINKFKCLKKHLELNS